MARSKLLFDDLHRLLLRSGCRRTGASIPPVFPLLIWARPSALIPGVATRKQKGAMVVDVANMPEANTETPGFVDNQRR